VSWAYLISDGGNVSVRGVDDEVLEGGEGEGVPMRLKGAFGSCASSTVTMKMGIEGVLKEKLGDALGEVLQVDPSSSSTDDIRGGAVRRRSSRLRRYAPGSYILKTSIRNSGWLPFTIIRPANILL
jgi:Fe-S cluster biogenesis protein NfuA